ncbi:CIC11C00000000491 [Sungouiella intermedia]|uniref:P-type Cu(+) transporter n=1 Tax=Sungouiella intermedia TaxID=45354 RepID=A0A1L0DJI0_9ASCO|nr:CIC11C00000000491 [[Candida] intermedia]
MTSHATLEVLGMTCAACSASVTEALQKVSNVSLATVSLLTNEASVTFLAPTTPQMLVDAIDDCGFDSLVVSCTQEAVSKTIVSISGMTCAACSGSITDALMAVDGIHDASVSLLTSSAEISHSLAVSTDQIISTIEDCGFDAVLESTLGLQLRTLHTNFIVKGMTCGACLASVTEALEKIPGVIQASVSQITLSAAVDHDSTALPEQLREVIEDCGFEASIVKSALVSVSQEDSNQDLVFQVYGIDESTELSSFQYNVEAVLNSLAGVDESHFVFKGELDGQDLSESSYADFQRESLIDELHVTLNTNLTGIRSLVDALNAIDSRYQFVILNSVDQSLTSQLKLLSKTKDIQYWRSTFFGSLIFGIPVLVLSLTDHTKFWRNLTIMHGLYWVSVLEFALTTHILFNLGSVFFKKFGVFLRHKGKNANMDVLVCISSLISYTFSVYSIFLSVWTGQTLKPPKVLFETVAMLVSFVSFGKWIENKAKGATSTALSRLMQLTPTTCLIVVDETKFDALMKSQMNEKTASILELQTRDIVIDLLQTDDIAVVLPGGKIPADGIIEYGSTEVDESIITGESLPVSKSTGDAVIGGSINGPHLIYMRVTGAGKNSQLHQIIDIVKNSQVKKAPVQRFADYIAARFVAAVLILSLLTLIVWVAICLHVLEEMLPRAFQKEENGKYFVCLKLAISVVVVACPCALGLAAPTAVMVGTGVGAQHGALIKGGDILEKASGVNVILFDKTGTLTTGDMSVVNFKNIEGSKISNEVWWNLIGSTEVNSEHPTGRALVKFSKEHLGLRFEDDTFDSRISDFEVLMGLGVKANVAINNTTYRVCIGNTKMVVKEYPGARSALSIELANGLSKSNLTVVHVIIDEKYCGFLELSDTIKPNAREVIDYLQRVEHYQVGIVTGDNKAVAETIGAKLGVPKGNIFSEVSPVDKDKVIVDMRQRYGGEENISIAFVGDGINDAPALVQADIGMAISTGTDIAIDSAEVVLMSSSSGHKNDLAGVITALQVSAATFRKIKWNFVCATVYNLVMMPFAMGCFLPFDLMISPPLAAATMACSSVSVVVNSLMLKNWNQPNIVGALQTLGFHEEEVGERQFSLKNGTLAEFNGIKRGSFSRRLRKFGVPSVFKRKVQVRGASPEYEMLASGSP